MTYLQAWLKLAYWGDVIKLKVSWQKQGGWIPIYRRHICMYNIFLCSLDNVVAILWLFNSLFHKCHLVCCSHNLLSFVWGGQMEEVAGDLWKKENIQDIYIEPCLLKTSKLLRRHVYLLKMLYLLNQPTTLFIIYLTK